MYEPLWAGTLSFGRTREGGGAPKQHLRRRAATRFDRGAQPRPVGGIGARRVKLLVYYGALPGKSEAGETQTTHKLLL